jgi:hypothetical protein
MKSLTSTSEAPVRLTGALLSPSGAVLLRRARCACPADPAGLAADPAGLAAEPHSELQVPVLLSHHVDPAAPAHLARLACS